MQNVMLDLWESKTTKIWMLIFFSCCLLLLIVISWLHQEHYIEPQQGFMLIAISYVFIFSITAYRATCHLLKRKAGFQLINESLSSSNDKLKGKLDKQNDIQKQTQLAFQQSEKRFRLMVDSLSDSFCALDKNLYYTYWNKASEELTGLTSEDVIGKHLLDVFPEAEQNQFLQDAQTVLQSGVAKSFKDMQEIGGQTRHFEIRIHPTEEGLAIYTLDITPLKETKAKLRQEIERLELTLWAADLGAWDWHVPTDKMNVNEQWATMLGYHLEDMRGNSHDWKDKVHPEDLPVVLKQIDDHLSGDIPYYRAEHRMKTRNGKWIWTLDIGKVVERDKHGKAIRMTGIQMNIQPNKELEAQLQEQKQHLELVIRSANMGTWHWNIEEDIWLKDELWHHMLGYDAQDLGEDHEKWKKITHPEDTPKVEEALSKHLEGQTEYYMCEHRILHKAGHWIWSLGSGIVVERDQEGNPLRMVGLLQDLTFLKEKEKELQLQKERLELIIQGADLGSWDWHVPSGSVTFNERWASMLGYRLEEIKPHVDSWTELVHPEDMSGVMEVLQPHLKGEKDHYQAEHRIKTKSGAWKWILDSGKVVERDQAGNAVRVIGIHMDIDHSKKMEAELRQQKEQLELIIWAADLGIWDFHLKEPHTEENVNINDRSAEMLGYSKDEFRAILGSNEWYQLYHPDDRESSLSKLEKHYAGEIDFYRSQHRNLTKNGEWKWILNAGKVVERDKEGNPLRFSGIQQDISEIKEAESSLYFFKNLVEYSNDPAYGMDPNDGFKMVYVNDAACRHFGLNRESIIGKQVGDWSPFSSQEVMNKGWVKLKKEKSATIETNHKKGNGEIVPVEVTANFIRYEEKELITGHIKDISERKAIENKIRKINTQLEQRVKERTAELEATNQELEAFSYSVSHDLRAPLRSIDGFSKALLEDYYDILDDEGKDFLQCIRNATSNMGNLIDDMLKLSRVTRAELYRETLDISLMVREIIARLTNEYPNHQVKTEISFGLMAEADRKLIHIALNNLLENAWKFTEGKEYPEIIFGARQEGESVVYMIKDNGAGFDMKYVHKLFGAFQRLHHSSEFEGTGIGLATVQRIVHRHGGKIWAEAEVNKGATFYFTLT